jgi:hypothetical protein
MKWKFKVFDDGDEAWEARRSGCRYRIYEEWPSGFSIYQDREDGWHRIGGTWPSEAEAKAAVEQRRAFPKVETA